MEKNIKHISNFITEAEKAIILEYIDNINIQSQLDNIHISEIYKKLNGNTYIYDISQTSTTKYLCDFQSSNNTLNIELPKIFHDISERISTALNINTDNLFLQIIDNHQNGKIVPHYDTSIDGYINYKCNICIIGEDYDINIDKDKLRITELDLYCFEASLYRHWTNTFNSRRVILSYGFALPYDILDRNIDDPRVRLSIRISKKFQN